jgi:glycerol-3-phosphate dehydrogenase
MAMNEQRPDSPAWPQAPLPGRFDGGESVDVEVGIIGAGIHGAALAREFSLRGLSCALVDRGGVGAGTSQWSSQLLHGGIRYMLIGDIRQMREGLQERAAWARIAPRRCWWEAFWMPHRHPLEGLSHRFGIGLYDWWGRERPGWPAGLALGAVPAATFQADPRSAGGPFCGATAYADLITRDQDLVRDLAASSSAALLDFHDVEAWTTEGQSLRGVRLRDRRDGRCRTLTARRWVFSLGPWTDQAMRSWFKEESRRLRLSAGIHLWFPPVAGCQRPWTIRRPGGRVLFVIPREGRLQVGTTEREVEDGWAPIMEAEREELYQALERFIPAISWRLLPVLHEESGVRPLVRGSGGTARLSREAVIESHPRWGNLSLVLGGKLTTARRLMEELATRLTGRPYPGSRTIPLKAWDAPGGPAAV